MGAASQNSPVDILGRGFFSFTDNAEKLCKGIVRKLAQCADERVGFPP